MGVVTAGILDATTSTLIEPGFELLSIDIRREFDRVPYAELTYIDGDPATQKFPLTDSDFFAAGKEIEIRLRYEGDAAGEKTVFKGVVIRQSVQLTGNGCILNVELSDKAVKMTAARKSFVFENIKDGDLIGKLLTANGVTAGTIATTNVTHPRLVQYYTTDWDLMLCRAEANGLLIASNDGTVSAVAPVIGSGADYTFEFGIDEIYSFELEADSRHQHVGIEGSSWDVKTQKMTVPAKAAPFELSQARLTETGVYDVLGQNTAQLVAGAALSDKEAEAWATGRMLKDRLSMLRGNIRVDGDSRYVLGKTVELKGMSGLFTGKTLLTGIRHEVSDGGWYTWLQFGLSAEPYTARYPVTDSKAGGLLPGVNGLQIGIVEKIVDPDNEFRVEVKIPALGADKNKVWARLATADAGKERGLFCMPEPGDEVILGFLNDDPRQPVILGSVNSSALPAPFKPADENAIKGFVTKSGLKLIFDDTKKQVAISTSDDQQVIIDEDQKSIELKDVNGNSVKLSADGITLTSKKDLILKADGDVKIEGSGKVDIKGSEVTVI
jgi:Rhs element Vgr protein